MSAISIPKVQRALVMQGGGSLGAYELGVFKALYKMLPHRDNEKFQGQTDNDNTPLLFDVLAGTSIGAINAAILANHVVKNKSWKGSWEILNDFWNDVSTVSTVEFDPTFSYRWNYYRYFNPDISTPEAARRYYSAKEFLASGTRNVFTTPKVISDSKFFDYLNSWYVYDNTPLRKLLEDKYLDRFPLKTTNKEQQPRLMLVSVDVQEAATVTFDSYSLKSEYGKYDEQSKTYEHTIDYPAGLTVDHVLASASVPISYDYTAISDTHNTRRRFWDGILLSNTPLRELLGQHKTFWEEEISEHDLLEGMWKSSNENPQKDTINDTKKVPDLEVFIVNLWPSKEQKIPYDYDGQIDRKNDILYHDKTEYDQKVALLVTDYIDLVKQIRNIALNHIDGNKENAFQEDLKKFLGNYAKSKFRTGENRKYVDLLKGRFDVNNVVRIERQDDPHTISNKWADFSSGTIKKMIADGYQQSLDQLKTITV
jgi:predicted acylesterase/phospholipase RssA